LEAVVALKRPERWLVLADQVVQLVAESEQLDTQETMAVVLAVVALPATLEVVAQGRTRLERLEQVVQEEQRGVAELILEQVLTLVALVEALDWLFKVQVVQEE
jgi:hypothetical protein